jgi:penicillin amidase
MFRFLLILPVALCVLSCSLITNRPVKKDLQSRFDDFPLSGVPLQSPAQIRWNDYQIPFIKAETDRDCAFLLGMVHAHLRLGQMTILREAANYRLAEYAGPPAVKIEQTLRTMQITDAADSIYAILPPETRSWLSDFVTGVNWYQRQMKVLPLEMRLLNIKPSDWTVTDILKIGRVISADVNWMHWFGLTAMQDSPDWKDYWSLLGTFGGGRISSGKKGPGQLEKLFHDFGKSGSNAFALSRTKTAMQSAIMASDPHLGLQLPNLWLIAGYQCPSYHVLGLMFPGIPMVMLGRNEDIAWSGTNMRAASSDLFELTPEQVSRLTTQKQRIKVRWWRDKTVEIRTSELGPVLSDAPYLNKSGKTFAMRWAGHRASDEMTALLRVNRAANWDDFTSAFATYAVSGQNFLYADRDGHIGLVPAVKIPVRSYKKPPELILAPLPENRWQGFLDSSTLPHIFDPPEGYIASANNNPVETDTPLGFFFSSDDRISRLKQVLEERKDLSFADVRFLQTDTYVHSSHKAAGLFAQKIRQYLSARDYPSAEQTRLLDILQNWNGRYDTLEKAPVVYQLLLYYFAKDRLSQKWDKEIVNRLLGSDMLSEIMLAELDNDDAQVKESLWRAFHKTVLKQKDYANWGEMHHLGLNHMLGGIPVIGKRYRYGAFPVGGTTNSLMKTAHQVSDKKSLATYGANARFVSILNDDTQNYFVLMGGQDGLLGGSLLSDQVPLWTVGEYIRIPFQWEDIAQEFPRLMQFTP